jgi:diguanylate cyclase (GGDEF)-like protein
MLLRWYTAITGVLAAGYLLWPYDLRGYPFMVVTLAAIPAVAIGLRRTPRGGRSPWWLVLAALTSFNLGNLLWIWLVEWGGQATGDGSFADVLFTTADVLILVSAMIVVRRRGRRDAGGIIDSVITALAVGFLLWDAVLLPALSPAQSQAANQIPVFINILVMGGTVGALGRVALAGGRRSGAVWMLALGIVTALAGNLLAVLTTDPVTYVRPDWTNNVFLFAYVALGCAALHPSAAWLTEPGPAPDDDLTPARMTFLGLMLAVVPLIGGGRALLGLPTDAPLVALGSAAVIPLVMVRIARLAAQRRAALGALHRLATCDSLTGLPNRAACLDRLGAELETGPDALAVLFCDLDGFKPVNDRLGHAAGDELLIVVADRLRAGLRDPDLVARFGGDEFVLVCRGPDKVEAICERIRELVATPITVVGEQVRVGLSVGVARALPSDTTDSLLTRADLAMYDAKKRKAIGELSLADR